APQRPPLAQRLRRAPVLIRLKGAPPLGGELLEAVEVDLVRLRGEEVSTSVGDEEIGAERLSQMRDVDLDRLQGGGGRAFPPKLVDQAIRRDNLAPMQQEHGQQGALFGAAEREGPLLRDDLEWTEYPKFQQSGRPTPLADPTTARPI